jgi:hypothetical protein
MVMVMVMLMVGKVVAMGVVVVVRMAEDQTATG